MIFVVSESILSEEAIGEERRGLSGGMLMKVIWGSSRVEFQRLIMANYCGPSEIVNIEVDAVAWYSLLRVPARM